MSIIWIVLLILAALVAVLTVIGFKKPEFFLNIRYSRLPGNDERYHPENQRTNPASPLRGKSLIFLGSSVTEGMAALGKTFAEYMEQIDGIRFVKEAVSGTMLVTQGDEKGRSYIPRMLALDRDIQADCFVCQLSTNDATQRKVLGSVSDSFHREDFDTETVAGAIEYIIAYAKDTWNCPVVFYTNVRYDSEVYGKMVELLLKIQSKWGIGVIDLWNDEGLNNISEENRSLYMSDAIHPTQAGYLCWWTPKFESYLTEYLNLKEGDRP